MTTPYFGYTKVEYLQHLANRYGDFGVSWNWFDTKGERHFTKKRTVIQLNQEDKGRLNKVQHRTAMPYEYFIELDDEPKESDFKLRMTRSFCTSFQLEYAVYKSRKGYHISVIDKNSKVGKDLINYIQSDMMFLSRKVTWSLEWTQHWKDKTHTIDLIELSDDYQRQFLGSDNITLELNTEPSHNLYAKHSIMCAIENNVI